MPWYSAVVSEFPVIVTLPLRLLSVPAAASWKAMFDSFASPVPSSLERR